MTSSQKHAETRQRVFPPTPLWGAAPLTGSVGKRPRWWVAVIGALAFLAAQPAVAVPPAQPALETVTLQLKWKHQFQFAGYYAAIEQGYYREAGLEVKLLEAEPGVEPAQAVLGGRAQFGIAGSDLVLLRSANQPVVALAPIFQHSPLIILASRKAGIESVHDLIGKRVMMESHAAELNAYLERERVPVSRLTLLAHSFDPNGLIEGTVDAISAYSTDEPFLLQERGFDYLTFTPRASGIDFLGDTLYTTERELRQHPGRVRAFVEATLRGWRYALAHEEEVVDLILSQYSRRHSREHLLFEAEASRRLILPDVVEVGYQNPGRWQHIAETYSEQAMLPEGARIDGLVWERNPRPRLGWLYATLAGSLVLLLGLSLVAARFHILNHTIRGQVAAIAAAERRSRSLTENAPFPIAITRRFDETLSYLNPLAATQLQIARDHATGRLFADFCVDPQECEGWVAQLDRQGFVRGRELLMRTASGEQFWATLSAAQIVHDDEPSAIVSFIDSTDRKRAEDARFEMERRILNMQRIDSLGVLAGGMAHDFNNLLMALMSNLDLARLRVPAGSPATASLDAAIATCHRAADLTRQMLAYAGRPISFRQRLDLGDLVRTRIDQWRADLPSSVVFRTELEASLPHFDGDKDQIGQVISNLLSNAVEATLPQAGTVTLTIGTCWYDKDMLQANRLDVTPPPGDFVFVRVSDDGTGMTADTARRIFEPFFSTRSLGRGLGLAAVSGIVRRHCGAILVDSQPGSGSTITVLFPVATGPADPNPTPPGA